jgi:hypothetical protein
MGATTLLHEAYLDLKFFCGFSLAEIAARRRLSERTVRAGWRFY